jgi:hypothetical protein
MNKLARQCLYIAGPPGQNGTRGQVGSTGATGGVGNQGPPGGPGTPTCDYIALSSNTPQTLTSGELVAFPVINSQGTITTDGPPVTTVTITNAGVYLSSWVFTVNGGMFPYSSFSILINGTAQEASAQIQTVFYQSYDVRLLPLNSGDTVSIVQSLSVGSVALQASTTTSVPLVANWNLFRIG